MRIRFRVLALCISLCVFFSTGAAFALVSLSEVSINSTNFPDPNFLAYIKDNFDSDNDDALSEEDIESIKDINVFSMDISSLEGIEHFTSLTGLMCGNNNLTKLDVSKNTALTELNCDRNQLTVLDLSNNTSLEVINIESQNFEVSALVFTEGSEYPYALNTSLLSFDASDWADRINIVSVKDSSGNEIEYISGDVMEFASLPASIEYKYDTKAASSSITDPYMNVYVSFIGSDTTDDEEERSVVTIPEDVNSREWRYQFTIPSDLYSVLISKFRLGDSTSIFQFNNDEILDESWSLDNSDLESLKARGESVVLNIPSVRPNNSGVYVMRYSLEGANVGDNLLIHGITTAVAPSSLEEVEYVFYDQAFNEITRVPSDGVVYVAMRLTAGTNHRGVITIVASLPTLTITPVVSSDELVQNIAISVSRDKSEILSTNTVIPLASAMGM